MNQAQYFFFLLKRFSLQSSTYVPIIMSRDGEKMVMAGNEVYLRSQKQTYLTISTANLWGKLDIFIKYQLIISYFYLFKIHSFHKTDNNLNLIAKLHRLRKATLWNIKKYHTFIFNIFDNFFNTYNFSRIWRFLWNYFVTYSLPLKSKLSSSWEIKWIEPQYCKIIITTGSYNTNFWFNLGSFFFQFSFINKRKI